MKKALLVCAVVVAVGLFSGSAMAQLTIYNANSAWVNVGGGTTWVLPASIPGCGNENEPSCEPTGTWYVNTHWSGIPSQIIMYEGAGGTVKGGLGPTDAGQLSDVITFDSLGPNGWMRIQFFSDPNLNDLGPYANYFTYATYTEDPVSGTVTGAIPICCELGGTTVNMASDGESYFDPFGYGHDTSDGIQFTGMVNGGNFTPEPGTLVLFGTGLIGAAGAIRRKLSL